MTLPVTRLFDQDIPHCSPMQRAKGAPTVFVNGRPWSRQFDPNTVHQKPNPTPPPECIPHQTVIVKGTPIVYPVKLMAGTIFKPLGPDQCTTTGQGSMNVFCP